MNDYDALLAQAERKPNSTAAIAIVKMHDLDIENRIARRESRRVFFRKLFRKG